MTKIQTGVIAIVLASLGVGWAGGAAAVTSPAQKCEMAKLKIAGKYNFCRLNAEAKAVKTGDPVDYSKCVNTLVVKWAKAETNGAGMCPTNGDQTGVQNQVTADANSIAARLSGVRFVDNGDGTVTDVETGLMWEQKTGTIGSFVTCNRATCPADNQFSGTYTTALPSTGTFTFTLSADGLTWIGSATDSSLGSLPSWSGTASGSTLSGASIFGIFTVSATVNCGAETISGTLGGSATGTLTGTAVTHSCPDPHAINNLYSWSASTLPPYPPNGLAYTNFLPKLNGTSADGSTTGCFANHCDWRVPTIAELQTILLAPYPCGTSPCIDQTIFGPTQSNFYWSSTTYQGSPDIAWIVGFGDGFIPAGGKSSNGYLRAVRGGS